MMTSPLLTNKTLDGSTAEVDARFPVRAAVPDQDERAVEPGSFRDRNGRIYYRDDVILRGISDRALADWEALAATRFFTKAVADGRLIPTRLLDSGAERSELGEWAGLLEHERIPFVSYPYEWSFGELKDAAILHLELLLAALDEGMTLKDGTSYNVQWRGTKPVFIDIPSFERLTPGEPWVGYRQFCQLFLFPLFMRAYLGTSFHPWLRGSVDGIAVDDFAPLLSFRDLFRAGVFKHAYLQSRLQAGFADSAHDVRKELRESQFSAAMIWKNAQGLLKLVNGLQWKQKRSEWADYADDNSYSEQDDQAKKRFIREVVDDRQRQLVWDLGSNTGVYSRIAAEDADYVVAMDIDHLAVERLYQSLVVANNRVTNNQSVPVVVAADTPNTTANDNSIQNNIITNNDGPGVVIHSNAPGDVVTRNIIFGNTISGNASLGPLTNFEDTGIAIRGEVETVTRTFIVLNTITNEHFGIFTFNARNGLTIEGRMNQATIPFHAE